MNRKLVISFSGWPWQVVQPHWANQVDKTTYERWGWNPFRVKGMGRFGGGWAFKFGVTAAKNDIIFDLGLGGIRFAWRKVKVVAL